MAKSNSIWVDSAGETSSQIYEIPSKNIFYGPSINPQPFFQVQLSHNQFFHPQRQKFKNKYFKNKNNIYCSLQTLQRISPQGFSLTRKKIKILLLLLQQNNKFFDKNSQKINLNSLCFTRIKLDNQQQFLFRFIIIKGIMNMFSEIKRIVKDNGKIKNFLSGLQKVFKEKPGITAKDFYKSKQYDHVISEFSQIRLEEIEEIGDHLPQFNDILALVLKSNKNFSLVFLIIPEGKEFKWHDHEEMNGVSKCLFGQVQIDRLNINKGIKEGDEIQYLKKDLCSSKLQPANNRNFSIIDPLQYNIHKIKAIKTAGFFDLMMPHYPKQVCCPFAELEDNEKIYLKPLPETQLQKLISLSDFIKNV